MRASTIAAAALSVGAALAQEPGYDCYPTCINSTVTGKLSFGQHYAVLNLDMINGIIDPILGYNATDKWISNVENWINVVHEQKPVPLTIFTRIYFSNTFQPEIGPTAPFRQVSAALGTYNSTNTQIYEAFTPNTAVGDVILDKTRYYAGSGNALEEILRTQGIDTVILSGVRTSGVILNTAYNLFNLDYNV